MELAILLPSVEYTATLQREGDHAMVHYYIKIKALTNDMPLQSIVVKCGLIVN